MRYRMEQSHPLAGKSRPASLPLQYDRMGQRLEIDSHRRHRAHFLSGNASLGLCQQAIREANRTKHNRVCATTELHQGEIVARIYETRVYHCAREHPLETHGAMINAELLYQLKRAGYIYREVGVQHLPRQGGRATGANLRVIARAFRELFIYARKWRREEQARTRPLYISERHPSQGKT